MANLIYDAARAAFAGKDLDWENDSFSAQLIDTGNYTPTATHTNLSQVASNARIGSAVALSGKAITATGWCDANDPTFSSVAGNSVEAILIYYATGTESTSTLIVCIDQGSGLPVTPSGSDIEVHWGTNGIFRL